MPLIPSFRRWLVAMLLLAGAPRALADGGVAPAPAGRPAAGTPWADRLSPDMDLAASGLPTAFYIGRATTTGFDTRDRADGMARALREVLVRVSGNPALARFARRYGVTIHVPGDAELTAWGVGDSAFPVVDSRDGAVMAGGTVTFRAATLGWVGIWRVRVGNDIRVWSVAGVELDDALDRLVAGAVAAESGHPPP